MDTLTLRRLRLAHQRLTGSPFTHPAEAIAHLAAVQSQDYAGAKWALGLRLSGWADAELDRAFNAGDILRTHVLRPTWHFVTPADIGWLLALTAPRVHAVNGTQYRKLGLTDADFARSADVFTQALRGGQFRTRDELSGLLTEAGIAATGQRLAYLVMHAELEGLICSGPRLGKSFTYALLAERAPAARSLARDESLAELARRYFRSRGPAGPPDFAHWSGLTLTDARRGLEAVRAELQAVTVGGQQLWYPAEAAPAALESPCVRLLSIYDEYLSGYKDRSAILDPAFARRLTDRAGAPSYLLSIDGEICGTWQRELAKGLVQVTVQPNRPLTDAEGSALRVAAEGYARFLGLALELAGL
jgi:hypothetical protein